MRVAVREAQAASHPQHLGEGEHNMTDSSNSDPTPSVGRVIDQVCTRFERAWQDVLERGPAGAPPLLEEFLNLLEAPARPPALAELLALDILYRRRRGDQPAAEDYGPRFPDLKPTTLAELLREPLEAPPTANATAGFPNAETCTVAGYVIEQELGRGAMGVVYKARHLRLKRLVALKVILSGPHAAPHELARFRTEAEAVARLQHPNIVQVFDIGEHAGNPYLALEFVDGGSLAKKDP
jgi:hypothetical protein